MDFDDLLFYTNVLLRDYPEILFKYQQKFKYIFVDEYQDTNHAQYLILKKLSASNENICVVGDDAQSIYAFRGANIQNILNFKKNYPDYKLFKLEQNYRSTKNIVNAANSVIKKNVKQIEKDIWTDNVEGERITLLRAESENGEGQKVAQSIFENQVNHQLQYSDFAILYRTNAQSRAFEESLRKLNIPYQIFGGLSFYKRKEIKDLIAYFRLTINHNDEEALKRIINYPARGLGQTTLERIIYQAAQLNVPMWSVIENPKGYNLQVNFPTQEKLIDFATKINSFTAQINTSNAYDLAFLIAQTTGVLRDLQDKSKEEPEHLQNAEALLNAIRDFVDSEPEQQMDETATGQKTLDVFLSEVSLMTDLDENDKDKNKEKDFNKVSLMTIHSAKGLEFPFVYIVGLEENLFPSFMSVTSRNELEEERRLFYVALTRAMKKAYMSYAEGRMRWGQYQFADPSRFIDEIDSNFIETMVNDRRKSMVFENDSVSKSSKPQYQFEAKKPKATPISTTPINSKPNFSNLKKIETARPSNVPNSNSELIIPGIDVEHEKFGLGHVLTIEGEGNNKKAIIFFDGIGQKTLLLQYAKLIVR